MAVEDIEQQIRLKNPKAGDLTASGRFFIFILRHA